MHGDAFVLTAVALSIVGVIARPFGFPEFVWPAAGSLILVATGSLSASNAWRGILDGTDVYLFLIGMMALAEVARQEGLFDWLATHAVRRAGGSASRLFWLTYVVGIIVTAFLSNDATAVVLTPAVYAAAKAAKAPPLPYLFICAMIANAASFVLPISNPANLVVFGDHVPALGKWVMRFGLASVLSIAATFLVLRWSQRAELRGAIQADTDGKRLSASGKIAGFGIGATAGALILCSAGGLQLGLPTFLAGALTVVAVLIAERKGPLATIREISWSVLPLVAGLFVLVKALEARGVTAALAARLRQFAAGSETMTAWVAGLTVAFGSNVVNNLPAGLLAGATARTAHASDRISAAILVGIDLGPNLSVTGSLATILWLVALRREGEKVSAWSFLKLGALVMPPALIAALAAVLLQPG